MRIVKKIAAALTLLLVLGVAQAFADPGETSAPPGETNSPPGETSAPPSMPQSAGGASVWFILQMLSSNWRF